MLRTSFRLILIFLCFVSYCEAEELHFNGRLEFYQWLSKGADASPVHLLELQDLWSSKRFDFHPRQHIEEEDFALTTQLFTNLTTLRLSSTVKLTDESLRLLSNLPKLKNLELKGDFLFSQFTDNIFFLMAEAAPQLERLSLEGPFPKVNGQSFAEAIQSMPILESVTLRSSYHACDFNENVNQIGSQLKSAKPSLEVIVNGVKLD